RRLLALSLFRALAALGGDTLATLERLRALDEIGDLLSALTTDLLEVARTVLRGDGLAALLADATEELGTVLGRRARAALLPDLLVELGAVLLGHKTSAHAARLGHGHATALPARHGPLLSETRQIGGRLRAAQVSERLTDGNDFATMRDATV